VQVQSETRRKDRLDQFPRDLLGLLRRLVPHQQPILAQGQEAEHGHRQCRQHNEQSAPQETLLLYLDRRYALARHHVRLRLRPDFVFNFVWNRGWTPRNDRQARQSRTVLFSTHADVCRHWQWPLPEKRRRTGAL
jgi:hypothetical protein